MFRTIHTRRLSAVRGEAWKNEEGEEQKYRRHESIASKYIRHGRMPKSQSTHVFFTHIDLYKSFPERDSIERSGWIEEYKRLLSSGRSCFRCILMQFLGVLVILLLLAACLAIRAFRIRRRYRTATQLALARGGPLPIDPHAEFWGLTPVRVEREVKRKKIPILWESEVGAGEMMVS